ncbi:MAG TPA: hypothetical protein VMW55_08700 [Nitrosopumilaceae archaeon]|nr:hypothetical protein [Nitrosopumilaceae archaeon]
MPDESCRKCGGMLLDYSLCGKCRTSIRFICRICGTLSMERFHEPICFNRVNYDEKVTPFPLSRHATI